MKTAPENDTKFKTCSFCGHVWTTREDFLEDPDIRVGGYQARLKELTAGLFLFTHFRPDCKTTLGFRAELFSDLYDGPIFEQRLTGSENCPGYCLQAGELRPCLNACECAFVREVLQIVKNWPKQPEASPPP